MSFKSKNKEFHLNEEQYQLFKIILKNQNIFPSDVFEILFNKNFSSHILQMGSFNREYRISSTFFEKMQNEFLYGRMTLDKSVKLLLNTFQFFLKYFNSNALSCSLMNCSLNEIKSLSSKIKFIFNKLKNTQTKQLGLMGLEKELQMNLIEIYKNNYRCDSLYYLKAFSILLKDKQFADAFKKYITFLKFPRKSKELYMILGKQIKKKIDHILYIDHNLRSSMGLDQANIEKNLQSLFDCNILENIVSFIQIKEAADSVLNKWFN
jgi:hypothetical protein